MLQKRLKTLHAAAKTQHSQQTNTKKIPTPTLYFKKRIFKYIGRANRTLAIKEKIDKLYFIETEDSIHHKTPLRKWKGKTEDRRRYLQ